MYLEIKINLLLFYSRIKDEGFKFNFDVSSTIVLFLLRCDLIGLWYSCNTY